MVVVKEEKPTATQVHKAKKMANFATTKMPKGKKEKAFGPFNSKNMDGTASTKKEFSKWEASKDEVHLVEQVWSSFDSLDSSEKEEENLEHANILKKPIMNKWSEKQAEEAQEVGRAKKQRKPRKQNSTLKQKRFSKLWNK